MYAFLLLLRISSFFLLSSITRTKTQSVISRSLSVGTAVTSKYTPSYTLPPNTSPWKSTRRRGILSRPIRTRRKTKTDRRRNTTSCDPKTTWPNNINFDKTFCASSRRFQRRKSFRFGRFPLPADVAPCTSSNVFAIALSF